MITSIIYHASKERAVRRDLNLCRTRYNRLKIAETVLWIEFRLERAQFVQAPRSITIDGLKRLIVFTLGVVYIRLWLTMGLAGVSKSPVLASASSDRPDPSGDSLKKTL